MFVVDGLIDCIKTPFIEFTMLRSFEGEKHVKWKKKNQTVILKFNEEDRENDRKLNKKV